MTFFKKLSPYFIGSVFLVTACTTATPYKAAENSGPGYRHQKLEKNRYRVVFKGNSETPRETVEIYLLYRAAELTKEKGYDYFALTERLIEKETDYDTTVHPSVYGYSGFGMNRFPYYAYGYPWAYGAHVSTDSKYEAVAYVLMKEKRTPATETFSYNAKEIMENLKPKIKFPD